MPLQLRVGLLGLALTAAGESFAQVEAFRYQAARVPVGRVLQYEKSNRDGTHPGRVSVNVAKQDRLESLKWDDEVGWATLVVADLDWTRFSVRRFESWNRIGGPGLKGTWGVLWADAKAGHIVEFELPIPDEPGFDDGRLRLLEIVPMSVEAWEAFKRARLGE